LTGFLLDSFIDTDAVALASHTGEVGAAWTVHPSYGTGFAVKTNRVYPGNVSDTCYYASGVPGGADYDVIGVIRQVTHGTDLAYAAVAGRIDIAANTMYCVNQIVTPAGGTVYIQLQKRVTGTLTTLGSLYTLSPGDGTDTTVTLQLRGSTLSVLVNGVLRVGPVTDTAITAAGRAGVVGNQSNTTVGFHIDSITANVPSLIVPTASRRRRAHLLNR
jgi:hypothetical protein